MRSQSADRRADGPAKMEFLVRCDHPLRHNHPFCLNRPFVKTHHHHPSKMNLNGDHHTILIEPFITHQLFHSLRPAVFSWMLEAEQCREVVGQVKVDKHCPLFHEDHYDGDDYHLWPWWVFFSLWLVFSGIRIVIPPRCAEQPVRITCRQLRSRLSRMQWMSRL